MLDAELGGEFPCVGKSLIKVRNGAFELEVVYPVDNQTKPRSWGETGLNQDVAIDEWGWGESGWRGAKAIEIGVNVGLEIRGGGKEGKRTTKKWVHCPAFALGDGGGGPLVLEVGDQFEVMNEGVAVFVAQDEGEAPLPCDCFRGDGVPMSIQSPGCEDEGIGCFLVEQGQMSEGGGGSGLLKDWAFEAGLGEDFDGADAGMVRQDAAHFVADALAADAEEV